MPNIIPVTWDHLDVNAKSFRLDEATLHALVLVRAREGSMIKVVEEKPASFPLDLILGNINGVFQYGYRNFSKSAKSLRLDGTVLYAELKTRGGAWKQSSFDLNHKLYISSDMKICAREIPAMVPVPMEAQEAVLKELSHSLDKNPHLKLAAFDHADGTVTYITTTGAAEEAFMGWTNHADDKTEPKVWYYRVGMDVVGAEPEAVFKAFDATAQAAVFHVASQKGHPITHFSAEVLQAKAGVSMGGLGPVQEGFPIYAGADAQINLVDLKASAFDLNLGLGVQTDVGLKDYTVGAHVLGCGFTVGKKISVSAFGSSFGIDLGRLFDSKDSTLTQPALIT